jgi:ribosomal protein L7/L12
MMNESMLIGLLVGGSLFVILARLAALERRLARLSRLDAKVDALLEAAGVSFDAMRDVPAGVREALEQGETILAIKRFREATGAGLKEAREFVDDVRRRQAATS